MTRQEMSQLKPGDLVVLKNDLVSGPHGGSSRQKFQGQIVTIHCPIPEARIYQWGSGPRYWTQPGEIAGRFIIEEDKRSKWWWPDMIDYKVEEDIDSISCAPECLSLLFGGAEV